MNIKDVIVGELKANTERISYMPKDPGEWNKTQGDKYLGRLSDVVHEWQFNQIADNIISKLPQEEVIAEGKLENIGISPNGVVYTIFKNLKWPHKDISNIIGKNIRLKVEVIND